jgi:hypothetical protein
VEVGFLYVMAKTRSRSMGSMMMNEVGWRKKGLSKEI